MTVQRTVLRCLYCTLSIHDTELQHGTAASQRYLMWNCAVCSSFTANPRSVLDDKKWSSSWWSLWLCTDLL